VPAPGCEKFERTLADPKFAPVGKDYVLFLHVTSGVKKDRNQDLPAKKGCKNSFPYAVWLDTDGTVIESTEHWVFRDTAVAIGGLDETGKRAKWYLEVKKKAAGGGNPEKIDLLLADVELEHAKLADVEKKFANLGPLTDAQKASVEALRVRDEIKPTVDKLIKGAQFEELAAAGKTFLAIHKAGRPAPERGPGLEFFWRCIVLNAHKEKDAAAWEESLKALKAKFGEDPGSSLYFHVGTETWKAYFEDEAKGLEQLKSTTKPAGDK
jgi:hypothetical protein